MKILTDSTQLTRRMKHLSNILNQFWKRWRNEYLAELRETHRHLLGKAHGSPQVSIGDVVIVHEEGLPRSFWKLGRIQYLITGKDGVTRGATVRVEGGGQRHATLNRPLKLLYPLEISSSMDSNLKSSTSDAPGMMMDPSREEPTRDEKHAPGGRDRSR